MIAVIPARGGSQRVKNKNIRVIEGHPLIAYSIEFAKASKLFEMVICTTDSEEIAKVARHYGCDKVVMRSSDISTSISPDIDWINDLLKRNILVSEYFCILRTTSPIKYTNSLCSAFKLLLSSKGDSIRAITKVRDHPGKVWTYSDKNMGLISPIIRPSNKSEIEFHARQYQDLPSMYVQTSSFEFIRTKSTMEYGTREGKIILGFEINFPETINIDYEDDLENFKNAIDSGKIRLIEISTPAYKLE